jgi:uncharacterized protein (TIGR03067 family)
MLIRVAYLGALALLLGVGGARGEDTKEAAKQVQGTWEYTSFKLDGKTPAKFEDTKVTVTVEGDKFTVKAGEKVVKSGTIKLDPKNEKAIDVVYDQEGKGITALGIYEIDGDTAKLCLDPAGKARPREFKSEANSGLLYLTAKRVRN